MYRSISKTISHHKTLIQRNRPFPWFKIFTQSIMAVTPHSMNIQKAGLCVDFFAWAVLSRTATLFGFCTNLYFYKHKFSMFSSGVLGGQLLKKCLGWSFCMVISQAHSFYRVLFRWDCYLKWCLPCKLFQNIRQRCWIQNIRQRCWIQGVQPFTFFQTSSFGKSTANHSKSIWFCTSDIAIFQWCSHPHSLVSRKLLLPKAGHSIELTKGKLVCRTFETTNI